ncbi:hypothetical protein LZ32DRAFT_101080 [Colletotrichum eremochloae]|nr:hypothetical protein LZ32DRAFT_101080 [Colletotrichum eremochloae]
MTLCSCFLDRAIFVAEEMRRNHCQAGKGERRTYLDVYKEQSRVKERRRWVTNERERKGVEESGRREKRSGDRQLGDLAVSEEVMLEMLEAVGMMGSKGRRFTTSGKRECVMVVKSKSREVSSP